MRILISAFAFAPGTGSEAGGAWRWAIELSKEHDIVVITDISRRPLVEPALASLSNPRLEVMYYRPSILRRVPLNSKTAQALFGFWQLGLLGVARGLHRDRAFDLIHHLSYGVFRQASWLGFVGPKFVFGPVGGGEDAPWRFKESFPFTEKLREVGRTGFNWFAKLNPFWHWAISRADLVIARTPETKARLPTAVQARTFVAQEIGAPLLEIPPPTPWEPGEPVELLFVGRLIGMKGVHFAVRALAELRQRGHDMRLTVIGSGPMLPYLAALVEQLALRQEVCFVPHMPQRELFSCYGRAHVFVFPSLHDSGGNVVPEALSAGVPVVCFNLGGPPSFVNASCGEVVEARDAANEEELVLRLADAIAHVTHSREYWVSLRRGALARAAELTWEKQIARIQLRIAQLFA